MEPHAHANDPTPRMATPTGSIRPDPPSSFGPTSNANPENPSTSPTITRGTGRAPFGLSQSMITIHSDMVATSRAAIPDGTRSSAKQTPPFPTANKRNPVTVVLRHSAHVGLAFVFHSKIGKAIRPKVKCRI